MKIVCKPTNQLPASQLPKSTQISSNLLKRCRLETNIVAIMKKLRYSPKVTVQLNNRSNIFEKIGKKPSNSLNTFMLWTRFWLTLYIKMLNMTSIPSSNHKNGLLRVILWKKESNLSTKQQPQLWLHICSRGLILIKENCDTKL